MQQFCAKVASIVGVIATLKFSAAVHLQCAAAKERRYKRWWKGGSIGGFQLLATVVFVALVAFRLFLCQIEQADRNAQPKRAEEETEKFSASFLAVFLLWLHSSANKSVCKYEEKSLFRPTETNNYACCAALRLHQQLDNNMLTS